MVEYIKSEPVVVLAVVEAAIVFAVAFGVPVTVEQKVAIAGLTAAVLTVLTRQLVTPMAKLAK
jgi:branched-subunit amino acid transport protein